MQSSKIKMTKRQFRIGELAKELRVKKFVIRFWEKEFDLESDRSSGGQRFYTYNDLQTFSAIKDLLYNKKFTISGAKLQLKNIIDNNKDKEIEDMIKTKSNINSDTSSVSVEINNNNSELHKISPAHKSDFQENNISENQEIKQNIDIKNFENISYDFLEKINLLKQQLINLKNNL
ncbi:MerR family transcriptional regulator [Candidatus Babeliales bacterium]|nr:MerR family transcriptional regulator [Candidatus Babeliales bacterium]